MTVDEARPTDHGLPNPILPEFWRRSQAELEADLATLRTMPPVFHAEIPDGVEIPPEAAPFVGPGAFVLTRMQQILAVSKNPAVFSSAAGVTAMDAPPEFNEFFSSMIAMDDPRHAKLRKVVSAGFTPRMLAKLDEGVAMQAARVIDEVCERGECDFVVDVAAKLPLKIVCDLMGIDEKHIDFVFEQTNIILGASDPEYVAEGENIMVALLMAGQALSVLMMEIVEEKRGNDVADADAPDLTTILVNAEIDGEPLTPAEIASFFILLVVAGNETTRNAIAWALVYLTDNPDQRALLTEDFEGRIAGAVEEIVRMASPVTYMRRTLLSDATIDGIEMKAGEKVLLNYLAANRDEDIFDDPYTFDIERKPNPHVGFGGPGPHFCLGAHLARREITTMLRLLFERLPDIQATGEPDVLMSSFIHGIKHLPATFTPTAPHG